MLNQYIESMKHLLGILLLALGVATAEAGDRNRAALKMQLPQQGSIEVRIDGEIYPAYNGMIWVKDLRPGQHRIAIRMERRNGQVQRRQDFIHLRAGALTHAGFHPQRGIYIEEIVVHGGNGGGNGYGHQGNHNGWNYDNGHHCNNGCNHHGNRNNRFQEFMYHLNRAHFDEDRLDMALRYIRRNGVNARQVSRMMDALAFEDNRLRLAKRAYRFTRDKDRYYLVFDALRYQSSRRALHRYIDRNCH